MFQSRQAASGSSRSRATKFHHMLTDAGYDQVVAAAPGHVEAVRRFVFDGLDRTRVHDLARVCDAILDRIDARPQG